MNAMLNPIFRGIGSIFGLSVALAMPNRHMESRVMTRRIRSLAILALFACSGGAAHAQTEAPPSADTAKFVTLFEQYLYRTKSEDPARPALLNQIRTLLDAGVDPNYRKREDDYTLLGTAAFAVDVPLVKLLLEKRADPNRAHAAFGYTPLRQIMVRTFGGPAHQAARLEIMNTLIAAGADVNLQPRPNRQSLLIDLAAACGAVGSDVETMRFLVSKGANVHLVDNQNKTALDWARYFRCKPYITYLESLGAKVAGGWPAKNDAPAIQAVLTRNLASLGSIPLAELQRISGRTRLGVPVTALHIAIEEGDPNVLDVLMKRKADWNTGDSFGDTPLHLAVLLGKRDLVRRLMEAGADPNKEGQGRRTPFGLAAGTDPELALLMLDLGAQPRDPQVLADALWTGNLELVKRLWRLGGVTEEHIRDMAGMGYVALTEFLVQQVPLKLKTAEAWDAEAKRNQQAYDVLAAKAAILPAVVRETTAISAQRGNFNITLDSWAPWVTEPPEMDVKKAKLSLHVPPSYSGNDPVPLYIFVHGPRTQDAFPSRGYPEVLNKHHTIWASFSYDWVPNAHRVAYAITAVYHLRRQFNIDPKRIYIGGFSGGTADAARAILAYPGMFRAGVSATCMHPSYFYNQHLGYRYALNQILLTTDLGDWEGGWGVSSTCVPRSARKTYFMQSANHGHEIQTPENLDLALTFAEQ